MVSDTQRGSTPAARLQADMAQLAEAIAATEQQVATTLAARARTRPHDADRLMALSRKAAGAAARERQDAQDYLRRSWNLMTDTQRLVQRSDAMTAQTIRTVIAFAEAEDEMAATLATPAGTRPRDADRLRRLSEHARSQAVRARQWAKALSAARTAAA